MHDATFHDEEHPAVPARWLRPELVAPWWEIALVLGVMLGPFAFDAIRFALSQQSHDFLDKIINTHGLTRNTAVESGLLTVFFLYLYWRGWRPADFRIRIDVVGTLLALPVAIVGALANILVAAVLQVAIVEIAPHPHGFVAALIAGAPKAALHHVDLSWLAIVIGSGVNAYLEELVFMGYAFHQFAAKRNPLFALLVMVFLRMLLHTYKGPVGMLGIGAFSFVYGLAYLKARRLWPLILGHFCTDTVVFAVVKLAYGR